MRAGRKNQELRKVKISRNYLKYPEGSVLIETGETKVICTASLSENLPPHKKGSGSGWVTAEYAMLPGATPERGYREGKGKGRVHEIQRLIGRSLRSVVDLDLLGERSIVVDADVIQADGGTRTAAITGSFVALYDAVSKLLNKRTIHKNPIKEFLAAVSVGVVGGEPMLDLCYSEDVKAEVDMNVVMTESGEFIEIQGTAEGKPFSKKDLDQMLALAGKGIDELVKIQKKALAL